MYFTIYGTCDSIDDASYPREVEREDGTTGMEMVHQNQVTLTIPGMREVVKVVFAGDVNVDQAWEDNLMLLKVTADKYTVSSGVRKNKAWAAVSFHGLTVEKADDRSVAEINKARKAAKAIAHTRRQEAQAKKLAKAS
jgi:hypothetical protein